MRGHMELISFVKELSDGLFDYLPEDQRTGQLTVEDGNRAIDVKQILLL
ncbi:hypothetical protein ALO68_01057 [Pseudomonas syringae pv. helianthi]|uniref:Uncharacterized protein n=2 Tax=Pseudomonas syringae group genomosp. 7 TaxID=251699 RepID=A0A0P9VZU9_9PSED|nr:hypothetical protein ALO68_01057 [Pseudomonas syringae pv. helianthi]KPY89282.1 hypothetical protein ALO44_03725 [Pseudomonas syringae pv. tagetis]RMW09641.1 hypothetical protein ALO98_200424 [Pseudomonas syringae pv. tagetis]